MGLDSWTTAKWTLMVAIEEVFILGVRPHMFALLVAEIPAGYVGGVTNWHPHRHLWNMSLLLVPVRVFFIRFQPSVLSTFCIRIHLNPLLNLIRFSFEVSTFREKTRKLNWSSFVRCKGYTVFSGCLINVHNLLPPDNEQRKIWNVD